MLPRALALLVLGWSTAAHAGFEVVALGVDGGVRDGNLTAYLLRADGEPTFLALDAGSLLSGIARGLELGSFPDVDAAAAKPLTPQGHVFRKLVGAVFVSHPHLDHVAGLVLGSPSDTKKPLYGLATTLDALVASVFNGTLWANFTDRGAGIGLYPLRPLTPGVPAPLAPTGLTGQVHRLSHAGQGSSMLLVTKGAEAFAYFGDTGPDAVDHATALGDAWAALAPLVAAHRLKGLILECSYPNAQPDDRLYGHLTPRWLLAELKRLEAAAGGPGALKGLPVVISHVKPSLDAGADPEATILKELNDANDLGVVFVRLKQGERRTF